MIRYTFIILVALIFAGCGNNARRPANNLMSERVLEAENGMVVSAHPESSRIGASILQNGGNAVDAAVATEFALAVCYPEAGNIGGGGFMVIRLNNGETCVIDYREKAPGAASRDMFIGNDGTVPPGISTATHLASGVPGTVAGMIRAHSMYGRLSFGEVIQPAIDLAQNGFPLPPRQAESLNRNRKNFEERNRIRPAFVREAEWIPGDTLVQPELATTLKRIRDKGVDGFYSGITAAMIVDEMKKGNGIISAKDLESYRAEIREPLEYNYRNYRIITVPPPSWGGITLLQLLTIASHYNLGNLMFHSPESVHLVTEAEKRVYADRSRYAGDPEFTDIPVGILLSDEYILNRMSNFNWEMSTPSALITHGQIAGYESEETTHYSVADSEGNAVSATTTLNGTFGNSIVVEGAGFLLNNEMDDFSLKPGFPNMYGLVGGNANAVEPGKRMLSSMTPTIVEKDGKLFLILGSPGGSTIPTSVFQVVTNITEYGMELKEAVDAPRYHHQWLPDLVYFEEDCFDSLTVNSLSIRGHAFSKRNSIGMVNAISINDKGKLSGVGDRRGYNSACGY